MKLFNGLRRQFGNYTLHNRMKETVRFKEFNNFDTAKSIGVIFNATKLDAFEAARDFILALRKRNINTYGLGYALTQEAASYFFSDTNDKRVKDIDVFSVGNVNWFYKPNNPLTEEFCTREFDILIDISVGHDLPLNFVVGLSKAKMKVGSAESTNPYYDLTFETHTDPSLGYYITQVEYYLSNIAKQ